jgi:hypothetical protein
LLFLGLKRSLFEGVSPHVLQFDLALVGKVKLLNQQSGHEVHVELPSHGLQERTVLDEIRRTMTQKYEVRVGEGGMATARKVRQHSQSSVQVQGAHLNSAARDHPLLN